MTVTATINPVLTAVETVTLGLDKVSDPELTHSVTGSAVTLNASSTPVASETYSDSVSLSSGSATIDLTALVRGNLPNLDMTGLKVQAIKMSTPAANTANVLVESGATNGYDLFGASTGEISMPAGSVQLFYAPEGLDDVGASDKTIDFTSADLDAVIEVLIIAG